MAMGETRGAPDLSDFTTKFLEKFTNSDAVFTKGKEGKQPTEGLAYTKGGYVVLKLGTDKSDNTSRKIYFLDPALKDKMDEIDKTLQESTSSETAKKQKMDLLSNLLEQMNKCNVVLQRTTQVKEGENFRKDIRAYTTEAHKKEAYLVKGNKTITPEVCDSEYIKTLATTAAKALKIEITPPTDAVSKQDAPVKKEEVKPSETKPAEPKRQQASASTAQPQPAVETEGKKPEPKKETPPPKAELDQAKMQEEQKATEKKAAVFDEKTEQTVHKTEAAEIAKEEVKKQEERIEPTTARAQEKKETQEDIEEISSEAQEKHEAQQESTQDEPKQTT